MFYHFGTIFYRFGSFFYVNKPEYFQNAYRFGKKIADKDSPYLEV